MSLLLVKKYVDNTCAFINIDLTVTAQCEFKWREGNIDVRCYKKGSSQK